MKHDHDPQLKVETIPEKIKKIPEIQYNIGEILWRMGRRDEGMNI